MSTGAPLTVAVAGGTGTLGSLVARELVGRGASVRVLSRNAAKVSAGAEHRRVDLTTGEGLPAALAGVDVVVDSASSQKGAERTLVDGSRRLVEAGTATGVRHHLAISIVGIEKVPMSYYKAKLAQEGMIEGGAVPWSILRASQFHQLLGDAFTGLARLGLRPTGPAKLQPIEPGVVAARLADAAFAEPAGRLPDIAGPRVQTLGELSGLWASACGKHRLPLRVPALGKAGKAIAAGALCAPEGAAGGEDFEEWLRHGR